MVLEGLKFKKLLLRPSHAPITVLLPKIDLSQNCVLLVKCVRLVYEITKYVLNKYLFLLRFFDMIHAYEKFQNLTSVSF